MAQSIAKNALDGLGVLRCVIEAGSFVGAAEALGVTQPAVSRAIARLEARVGVRLFERTARAISLTEEGREFYDSIAPHVRAIEEATIAAGRAKVEVRGRLRLNVDAGTGQVLLVPHLAPFQARYPDLFVDLAVRDRLGDLVRDGFDIALRVGNPEPSALKARVVMRSRIVTCASPEYLARHGTPRKPSDVEKHRCVLMRDPSSGTPFGWAFQRGRQVVDVKVSGSLMVNHFGPMLSACLSGQGIAQLLEFHARDFLADGRLVHVLPQWADETYPLYAYHHSGKLMSAKVRAFMDFVVALMREP
jgi:DNA-binding transcriptional LysR family regulator